MTILTPCGAMVLTYLLGQIHLFQRITDILYFEYHFCHYFSLSYVSNDVSILKYINMGLPPTEIAFFLQITGNDY